MLKKVYGEMIIKKGSVLYHTSDELFEYKRRSEKPMLFCTFHPSEWEGVNDYVTPIRIDKDLSLFFMIEGFRKTHIFSALNTLFNNESKNLSKQKNNNLKFFSKKLKKENFDGWFSSIENKNTVEVALINNKDNFTALKTVRFKKNWRNGNYLNNVLTIKNWGKRYPICTINIGVEFNINERFKPMIKEYKDYEKKSKFPNEHILQVILKNAIINYHSFPYQQIKWNL